MHDEVRMKKWTHVCPFCNSSHFLLALPIHNDIGCPAAENVPIPGILDTGGNSLILILFLALFVLFPSGGDVPDDEELAPPTFLLNNCSASSTPMLSPSPMPLR